MEIKKKVNKLIRRHGTNDPFIIAKELNILVVTEPLGAIRGYYQYFKRNRIIHINQELCDNEKLITCAHELGHAVLHPKLNALFIQHHTLFVGDRFEREANKFAAELLLADNLLEKYSGYSLEQIASMEGVHVNLVELKFELST